MKDEWLEYEESTDRRNPPKRGKQYKPVKHNPTMFIGKSHKGRGGRSK